MIHCSLNPWMWNCKYGESTKKLSWIFNCLGLAPLTHLDVHHVALGLIFGLEFLRLHDNQLPQRDFQELCYFSAESVVEFVILSQAVSWEIDRTINNTQFIKLLKWFRFNSTHISQTKCPENGVINHERCVDNIQSLDTWKEFGLKNLV